MIQESYFVVFTQKSKDLYPHKNLCMDVYSIFIHDCQNLEATKMSFNRQTNWYI